jgi:D-glycero-D-manno-heptose 1,7-bisphosphate phosphatase
VSGGRRGLILDRDGTLIDVVRDEETGAVVTAFHPSQLRLLPGVIEGLAAASRAGFVLAIATNQPGPAKGQCSAAAVARTNAALVALLASRGVAIEAVEVCMHHPEGGPGGDPSLVVACGCRKPAPGMLSSLCDALGLDRSGSWGVGDTAGDVRAARAAGLGAGLVFPAGRCELCPLRAPPGAAPDALPDALPDLTAPSLDLLVARILGAR